MISQQQLATFVAEKLSSLHYPTELGGLIPVVRYGLEAGGKHLRPVLTIATCMAFGGSRDQALHQALAVEIFHNFTLVHDDVMDRSDLRRGHPTVRAQYGDSMAVLSGDATLTLAYMQAMKGAGARLDRVLEVFNRGANEVYAGQELDMQFEDRRDVGSREYLHMILLKTAALLRAAVALGAVMADASEQSTDAMKAYAIGLGMAFQLRDDYLDTFGDEATFGKPIGGDIVNNKKTWLLTQALESDRADELWQLLDDPSLPKADKISRVKTIYEELNLPHKCCEEIDNYSKMAVMALEDAEMRPDDRKFFADLAMSARTRQS